jgi:hypothetical protein
MALTVQGFPTNDRVVFAFRRPLIIVITAATLLCMTTSVRFSHKRASTAGSAARGLN